MSNNQEEENFVDIKIVGVDQEESDLENQEKLTYIIHFMLSDIPQQKWLEIFKIEKNNIYGSDSHQRDIKLIGQNIIINCKLSELKTQLSQLKKIVDDTNYNYRAQLQAKVDNIKRIEIRKRELKQKLLDAISDLEFD